MVNDSSGDIMTPVFRYGNAYDTEAEAINNLQYIIAEQESEGM